MWSIIGYSILGLFITVIVFVLLGVLSIHDDEWRV
jgi:hypothetical protein